MNKSLANKLTPSRAKSLCPECGELRTLWTHRDKPENWRRCGVCWEIWRAETLQKQRTFLQAIREDAGQAVEIVKMIEEVSAK